MGWAKRTRERVVIGLPRGGSVHGAHFDSMLGLLQDQWRNPERGADEVRLTGVRAVAGLYIEDNRNIIARRFLNETDAAWLLMLDSDIQFDPSLVEQLLEAARSQPEAKVLSGNVPLDVYSTVAFYAMPQPGVFAPLRVLPDAKVFEADAVGTAIMLIHRDVLQRIREQEGECWFFRHKVEVEERGDYPYRTFLNLGEDISFSLRARDAGFSTWVVQGLTGVVHHNLAATRRQLAEAEEELKRLRGQAQKGAA